MCILRYNNVETESGSSTPEDAVAPDLDWSRSFFQRPGILSKGLNMLTGPVYADKIFWLDGEVKHLFNENELMRGTIICSERPENPISVLISHRR